MQAFHQSIYLLIIFFISSSVPETIYLKESMKKNPTFFSFWTHNILSVICLMEDDM